MTTFRDEYKKSYVEGKAKAYAWGMGMQEKVLSFRKTIIKWILPGLIIGVVAFMIWYLLNNV